MDLISIFSDLFASQDLIFRIGLIILIALYGLFALIVAIQINNLNRVVTLIGVSGMLNLFALVHFFGAIALLLLSVLSL